MHQAPLTRSVIPLRARFGIRAARTQFKDVLLDLCRRLGKVGVRFVTRMLGFVSSTAGVWIHQRTRCAPTSWLCGGTRLNSPSCRRHRTERSPGIMTLGASLEGELATVVGAGRIGTLLASAKGDELAPVRLLRRQDSIEGGKKGPIYVCTRNDDLAEVVAKCPPVRRGDLVFLQNGMLRSFLLEHNLEHATQALVFFAVPRVGDPPADGGGTVVWGPWAAAFAARVRSCGCQCTVLEDKREFDCRMIEKLLWICIFGVLSESQNGMPVGEIAEKQPDRVRQLVDELAPIAEREVGLEGKHALDRGQLLQSLLDYSKKIPDFVAGFKEYRWRNGWFIERQRTPLHWELVERCRQRAAKPS